MDPRAKLWRLAIGLASVVALPGASWAAEPSDLARFQRTARHMGVEFEVVLYAPGEQQAAQAFARAFERIAALDGAMSDYDPASELSRLSETSTVPPGTLGDDPPPTALPVRLSDDLWRVLAYSQQLSQQSEGAFDVTIGPLSKLWRRARRQMELPATERLVEARAAVGHQYLRLDPEAHTAQLLRANMRLDLGGIAKGLAADEALAEIRKCGLKRALVRASGDIAVGDPPPGETGWRIAIAPLDPDRPPTQFVRLANRAISTSGDARQHLTVSGRRYSHIIDPRTGMGISGRSSVSVIARSGIEADAVATTVSVLGPDKGAALARSREGVALWLIVEGDDAQRSEVKMDSFAAYEEPAQSK